MTSIVIRGSVIAAVAAVLAFNCAISSSANAQQVSAAAAADVTPKGEWAAGTTYAVNDLVTARGSSWRAIKASTGKVPGSTSPNNAKYWELFSRGFNPLGAYSSATTYQPDDLVTSSGSTWRAKKTITNKPPVAGANWEQMASAGAAGATGATGPAGPNTGIGDGMQNAPSISFTGDADTGIFHPSAGNMALVQNGALMLHTFGANNAGFGAAALQSNSSGTNNTAVGYAAMYPNSSGSHNTALGSLALGTNVTGANNTAVGSNALANSTTADNTAVGYQALMTQNTGFNNTAVGSQALTANTTGTDNIAIGKSALAANTNVNDNVAIGSSALASFSAVGGGVGGNIAIGTSALANDATGRDNVAIGYNTLFSNLTGASNTVVGSGAAGLLTSGSSNTAVGGSTLGSVTTGSNNIALGWGSGTNAGNISDSIFIGNFGDFSDTATIKIGIQGTQTRAFMAGISGVTTGNNDAVAVMVDSAGQLGVTSSSRRYKYDITTMADVSAMLAQLRPVTFRYKQAQDDGAHPLQYGLIAEEVADVLPYLTVFNKDGSPETVKYHLLPTLLLAGWQAQQKTIAAQAEKIGALEERLRKVEALLPQTKAAALQ